MGREVIRHPLLEASYAAARRHLKNAREAQKQALLFGMLVYKAGARGRGARMLRKTWDDKRSMWLREALAVRSKIRLLRAELRRLELEDTIPPQAAASA